jgi:hypothetical protein
MGNSLGNILLRLLTKGFRAPSKSLDARRDARCRVFLSFSLLLGFFIRKAAATHVVVAMLDARPSQPILETGFPILLQPASPAHCIIITQ